MNQFISWSGYLIIVTSAYEIINGKVLFMNGAYRLSGGFYKHPLAYGLYTLAIFILWTELKTVKAKGIKKYYNAVISILLFAIFMNTHSRMLQVALILSYSTYFLLKQRHVLKIMYTILGVIALGVISYNVVMHTNISPRLRYAFKSIDDPSSNERVRIINNSIKNLDTFDLTFGIGLGKFSSFYMEATNETKKKGVAAHNNYLLFLVESGILGLLLFLFYQFLLMLKSIIKIRAYPKDSLIRLSFIFIFIYEILSFLLNNYYFYQIESLVWIFMAVILYKNEKGDLIKSGA
ncbi:O-antigen ligase family protein [Aquimarina celericrescens]|uniref:O-antigen ligase family protein n=1 Tax=Aquimarina celericrescens TaxID=1964542 RepID=A0ABW5AT97_9FLAO